MKSTQTNEAVHVDRKLNAVIVRIQTGLYPRATIEAACRDYEPACSAHLTQEGALAVVELVPKTKDIPLDTLGYEFCNYLLGLLKTKQP